MLICTTPGETHDNLTVVDIKDDGKRVQAIEP